MDETLDAHDEDVVGFEEEDDEMYSLDIFALVKQQTDISDTDAASLCIAEALNSVADSLIRLGNNDASTHLGALEGLSMKISESLDGIAGALRKD